MDRRFLLERPHVVQADFGLSNVLVTHQTVLGAPQSHSTVFLIAGILSVPADFVTREIPRICRGFFLVDRADQMEEVPCLTAGTKTIPVPHFFSDSGLARIDNNDSRPLFFLEQSN